MESLLERLERNFREKSRRHASLNKNTKLYQRLHNLLKDGIINNEIPAGSTLPASRVLADRLAISRSTVVKAYELLRLEGYTESKAGSGNQVKFLQEPRSLPEKVEIDAQAYPEISKMGQSFQKNVGLINSTDDKSLAFRPGLPPLDIFPVTQWKNLSNLYWRHIKSSALSYSPSSGIDQLKSNIASYLNLSRRIKCEPHQIIIVSGSLQSLYLLGSTLLNPGDGVIMEEPTFPNVHSIFKGLGADIQAVPIDDSGIQVEAMPEGSEAATIKLVHSTPSCHYPIGTPMSLERKQELLAWARRNKAIIIENDYEHEVHNYREYRPSIYSLDTDQRTVYLGTFNRLLHPSIRIGYMVLPEYLLPPVEALLKHSHRFVPPSIQVVLNQFIEKHYLHNHIHSLMQVADERLALFTEQFESHFKGKLRQLTNPVPSLHTLALLPNGVKDTEVVAHFAQHNIVTHAYSKCFVNKEKQNGLILGYSSVRKPIIRRKLSQMGALYAKL